MKTYRTPRKRSYSSRKRRLLSQMDNANHEERTAITMQSCETEAHARIQDRVPDETPAEIERRVAFVMKGGAKPTKAQALTPGAIPAETLKARKVARKQQVKANHRRRQEEELKRRLAKARPTSFE